MFSATWATWRIPTRATATPGALRVNWSARCPSVANPGNTSPITGGSPWAARPWRMEPLVMTVMPFLAAAARKHVVSSPSFWFGLEKASGMPRLSGS